MSTTTHRFAPEELMALLDGELSADRAQSVSTHMGQCAECSEFAALGALPHVSGHRLRAVGGQFTVEERHEFFRSEAMRGGAHARSPFWAMGGGAGSCTICVASFLEDDE